MDSPFLGQVQTFGFQFAPRGWALCQGQILPIAQNTALFSLLGTTYGGNGQTTFGLPDLRGRVAIGQGQGPGLSPYVMGQISGTENVTLISTQIPPVPVTLKVSSGNASQAVATAGAAIATPGTLSGRTFTSTLGFNTTTPDIALSPVSGVTGGGSQPHSNLQPYLTLNYSIALTGIFPSRN